MYEKKWSLIVNIDADVDEEGDIVVVAYTPYRDGQQVAGFRILNKKVGRLLFGLESGDYRVAIFHDRNGNLTIDPDEPAALAKRGRRLRFSDVRKHIEIDLAVPEEGTLPKGFPRELATLPETLRKRYHVAYGDILNLNSSRFSKSAGRMGLWEPARFLKTFGFGIYALEEYDPEKTPVLFINGAGGSAQNWRFFFDRLDRTRFQAWFFLYPSGLRIRQIGNMVNELIRDVHKKFNFDRIHLVAHSMGGLVGREACVNHISDGKPILVDQFITISTPWNGHRMAKRGVKALSNPVPSWHDMVPGSRFLQTVFTTPLKPKVDHHLLFGYIVASDGDGTVALDSVLMAEAQSDAVQVHAFQADHVGVLSKEDVLEFAEDILLAAEQEAAEPPQTTCPCPEISAPKEETSPR